MPTAITKRQNKSGDLQKNKRWKQQSRRLFAFGLRFMRQKNAGKWRRWIWQSSTRTGSLLLLSASEAVTSSAAIALSQVVLSIVGRKALMWGCIASACVHCRFCGFHFCGVHGFCACRFCECHFSNCVCACCCCPLGIAFPSCAVECQEPRPSRSACDECLVPGGHRACGRTRLKHALTCDTFEIRSQQKRRRFYNNCNIAVVNVVSVNVVSVNVASSIP